MRILPGREKQLKWNFGMPCEMLDYKVNMSNKIPLLAQL